MFMSYLFITKTSQRQSLQQEKQKQNKKKGSERNSYLVIWGLIDAVFTGYNQVFYFLLV